MGVVVGGWVVVGVNVGGCGWLVVVCVNVGGCGWVVVVCVVVGVIVVVGGWCLYV